MQVKDSLLYIQSIDRPILSHTTQHMKQSNIISDHTPRGIYSAKDNKPANSKMVSFRMPMAYIEQLQQQAQTLGKSKSEVLRMGLDALKGNGGQ